MKTKTCYRIIMASALLVCGSCFLGYYYTDVWLFGLGIACVVYANVSLELYKRCCLLEDEKKCLKMSLEYVTRERKEYPVKPGGKLYYESE